MTTQPLIAMGRWRGLEGAIEITVPLVATGVVWYLAYTLLSAPNPGRPFTLVEVWCCLGMCVGITSWAVSRQLYLARRRNPWSMMVTGMLVSLGLTWAIASQVAGAFETRCVDTFGGELVPVSPLDGSKIPTLADGTPIGPMVCKVGGVTDNTYLVGTAFRPSWDAKMGAPLVIYLALMSALATLGLRMVRVRPTQIAFKVSQYLRFAPAGGTKAALGKPAPKLGKVVACNNATLWGETCGQIYAVEKPWYPGEWCQRCQQAFTPTPRRFTFKVVSLFTADVDVLNGLERLDTVGWQRGDRIAPDGRISGQERWVTLATMDFPDVITVSQMLALVHELVPKWAASNDVRVKVAAGVAQERASRVSCWFWRGSLAHRLTYARPTTDVSLAIGPQRLRDLIEDTSEELWLQLDVGLVPLELRTGFRKTFVEEGRAPELQNSKFDLWMPVANPNTPKAEGGLWIPRVEGNALRLWLSMDRLRDSKLKGVTIPLPYLRVDRNNVGQAPDGHDLPPKAGTLDFVRYKLEPDAQEPERERAIGASLSEWDWLEWRQIELLRQEALVLE